MLWKLLQQEFLVASTLTTSGGVYCNVELYKEVQRDQGGDCNGNTFNCCNPLFELHVTGITIAGTTQIDGEEALQETVQVQQ